MKPAMLPRIHMDYNAGLDTNQYYVGATDAWQLTDLTLSDGMQALFEQRGELDMQGTLRQQMGANGAYWVAEVNPATLRYHFTGTDFYVLPHDGTLTLGIEGTKEGDALARFQHDGDAIVLTNGWDAVEARIQVEVWDGKRVWLAAPDWATYFHAPPPLNPDREYLREGEHLGLTAGQQHGTEVMEPEAVEQLARDTFIALILAQPRVLHGSTLGVLEQFRAAFARGYQRGHTASSPEKIERG